MPKVNIYEHTYGGVNAETGERLPDPQPRRISIGWSKGQHAQLGIGWVDETTVPEPNLTAAMPAASITLNPSVSSTTAAVPPATGWSADFITFAELDENGKAWLSQWIDLDRQTINQLIRELRTARDAAFGRDE